MKIETKIIRKITFLVQTIVRYAHKSKTHVLTSASSFGEVMSCHSRRTWTLVLPDQWSIMSIPAPRNNNSH